MDKRKRRGKRGRGQPSPASTLEELFPDGVPEGVHFGEPKIVTPKEYRAHLAKIPAPPVRPLSADEVTAAMLRQWKVVIEAQKEVIAAQQAVIDATKAGPRKGGKTTGALLAAQAALAAADIDKAFADALVEGVKPRKRISWIVKQTGRPRSTVVDRLKKKK